MQSILLPKVSGEMCKYMQYEKSYMPLKYLSIFVIADLPKLAGRSVQKLD